MNVYDSFNLKLTNMLYNRVIKNNQKIDIQKEQIIFYGIKVLVGELSKLFILGLIFAFFGCLKGVLFDLIILGSIRIFLGGTHQNTGVGCLIQSAITFSMIEFMCMKCTIDLVLKLGIFIGLLVMCILLAPIISDKRGIYSKYKRRKIKSKGFIMCCFWMFISSLGISFFEIRIFACMLVQLLEMLFVMLKNFFEKINSVYRTC